MVEKPGPKNEGSSHDNVMVTPQGNSKSYTLSRLKRESPELFAAAAILSKSVAQDAARRAQTVRGDSNYPGIFDALFGVCPKQWGWKTFHPPRQVWWPRATGQIP